MVDQLYPRNRRLARNIAVGLLGFVFALAVGLDFGLGNYGVAGYTVKQIALVVIPLWVGYGIWKFKFG